MISPDQLVSELNSLGVSFLRGGNPAGIEPTPSPTTLVAALADQSEARLRLALIPLFLVRPDFAEAVPEALATLDPPARVTLCCYYTAAVLLQALHTADLARLLGDQPSLPDYVSVELDLPPAGDPQQRLRDLGDRQRTLSGLAVNWTGAYHHAAERLLKRLELERQYISHSQKT